MIRNTDNFERANANFPDRMSKVIAVLRHAQSAGKQSGQQDYDRVLTMSGIASARTLGINLHQHQFKVDFIVASAASRVRLTVGHINETLHILEQNIQFHRALYEATPDVWMEYLFTLADVTQHVLLVGHNPCLSMLATTFSGRMMDLAPGQLVAFDFEAKSWREIRKAGKEILNLSV